jgi:hypothetical protein
MIFLTGETVKPLEKPAANDVAPLPKIKKTLTNEYIEI